MQCAIHGVGELFERLYAERENRPYGVIKKASLQLEYIYLFFRARRSRPGLQTHARCFNLEIKQSNDDHLSTEVPMSVNGMARPCSYAGDVESDGGIGTARS